MKRALALTLLVLGVLAPGAAARDPETRIINGSPASEGEYPAQGYLQVETSLGFGQCGGTVVSPTKFVTAAHCAAELADDGTIEPLPPSAFVVFLGEADVDNFDGSDAHFISSVAVHPDYAEDAGGNTNDVAVLTFDAPVTETPMRVIRPSETALWEPGDIATIIGWGVTETGAESDDLREATAPIRSDADCAAAYGVFFVESTMVCAGAADPPGSTDTCQGDSGGPLLVDDGPGFTTTGVVSWGNGCNLEGFPGIYSRIGDQPLNAWVRGQIQRVDFVLQTSTPRAGEPVPFAATSPAGGSFSWDFDDNGTIDATGAQASHVFPLAGEQEVVLRITDPDGEAAEQRREIAVGPGAPPPPVVTPPLPLPTTPGPVLRPATLLFSGNRATVRRGKFKVRINFSATAPTGKATVEVFRGKRKIGTGKTTVRRGGSRQVSVKLTKRGRRLLSRAKSKRLRVKVQVRVGRRVLASRTVSLRR